MAHTEKKLDSQTLFQGRIIEVHKDSVELENGKKTTRELVMQFRYPYQKEIIELPAGKIELGEDPRICGIRELEEECGCVADRFEKLTQLYPTPAYCTEVIHIYYAEGLHRTQQHLDPGEFLTVLRVPFEQAVQMVLNGEIEDAKTQIGILQLAVRRAGQKACK